MKILIYMRCEKGNPADIFRQIDYNHIVDEVYSCKEHAPTNSGNKVWLQGIVSELSTEENDIFFLDDNETWDEINNKYDAIVFSTANLLCRYNIDIIDSLSIQFEQSRIPIYVIAIGAQASSYDDVEQLVSDISLPTKRFVNAIYNSGGELSLRGYFTKELLDRICPNSAFVTGCPSLFQNGRDLKICTPAVSRDSFKLAINGSYDLYKLAKKKHYESHFIDQDCYFDYIYDQRKIRDSLKNSANDYIEAFGISVTKQLLSHDIKLFYDTTEWRNYFINNKITFSYGSRIHGNIMAILSGVPALVVCLDSRTREMVELFHIPNIKKEELNLKKYDPYELYDNLDYSSFNKEYPRLYDAFESFLVKCNLVKRLNTNNVFWNKDEPIRNIILEDQQRKLLEYINCNYMLLSKKCISRGLGLINDKIISSKNNK